MNAFLGASCARSGAAEPPGEEHGPSNGENCREPLFIDPADPAATASRLRDLLAAAGHLYDRGGPTRLVPDGSSGGTAAKILNEDDVVRAVHQISQPFQVKQCKDGAEQPCRCELPHRIARLYLGMTGEWHLPRLRGICHSPLLTEGGGICTTEGYDQATGLYLQGTPALSVPAHPTGIEARQALRLLREAFCTFPFADAARMVDPDLGIEVVDPAAPIGLDESCFLAGLLSAVCRASLPLAPGMLVRGAQYSGAGTGKGKLVRAICTIAFGRQPGAITAGDGRAELDKRIAAALMEGRACLFIDNVNATALRSDLLASVITEQRCETRSLGRSAVKQLDVSAFVAVTGNGLSVSEDLARRFLVVHLDAGMENPEARPFPSGFEEDLVARRASLLSACLTIWRWGQQQASAFPTGRGLGSFEVWCRWVRDPLVALGCRDPVDAVMQAKAEDPSRRRMAELFEAWHAAHGERPVKVSQLHPEVQALLNSQGRSRQHLTTIVQSLVGVRMAGLTLTKQAAAGQWGAATYALRPTGSVTPRAE